MPGRRRRPMPSRASTLAVSAVAQAARPIVESLEGRSLLAGAVLAALEAQVAADGRDVWLEESAGLAPSPVAAMGSGAVAAAALPRGATFQPAANGSPAITSVSPADGATGVLLDVSIRMTVHLPNVGAGVDSNTLIDGIRIFNTATGDRVNSIRNTSGGGDIIVITPRSKLAPNTQFTIQVNGNLKDATGASFENFTTTFTTGTRTATTPTTASFTQTPQAATLARPWTAVTFGPDGGLYGATRTGQIYRYTPAADGTLGAETLIDTIRNVSGGDRLVTGIEFDPRSTAASPILFVSHGQGVIEDATNWTGKVTKLSGATLGSYQDVVTGLPRSVRDHLNNQMKFGPDGALYLIQGSMSAAGAPDSVWGNRSETLLSGAVLRIDVDDIGSGTVNVKTAEGGAYDPDDPGADVTVYASGIRNAYDMVWHRNGQLYMPANGTAAGGNAPAGDGAPALADVPSQPDFLYRIRPGGYYGHPNPSRGEFVMYGGNPTGAADRDEVGVYPVGTDPDDDYVGSSYTFGLNYSPNGVIEYRGGEFGGTLDGKLLVARFSAGDDVVILGVNRDGAVTSVEIGAPGLTNFNDPLDLIQDPRTGYLYVAEHGGQQITLLKQNQTIAFNKPQLTFSDVRGGAASGRQKLTWTNRSGGNVTIPAGGVRLVGRHSDHFKLLDAPAPAVTLAPGQSLSVRAVMDAPATTTNGIKHALLRLTTTQGTPPLDLPLRGIVLGGVGGANEPSLARIMETFNYGVRVGDEDPGSVTLPDPLDDPNDEVSITRLFKARAGGVTIEPLATFAPAGATTVRVGYYTPGNPKARTSLYAIDGNNAQTIAPAASGAVRFDPGDEPFGLFAQFPPVGGGRFVFSQDPFNDWEPNTSLRDKVRFYPLRNSQGAIVRNAYVVAFEEQTGTGDHQDHVYVIRNVTTQTPSTGLAVTGVNLLNAATNTTVGRLSDGGTIDLNQTPQFSLEALVSGTPGSVRFAVDGATVRTENFPPYTIAGENGTDIGDYLPFDTTAGTHTLTVTPFTGSDATGAAGTVLTLTVTVARPLFATRINFQPKTAAVPDRYAADVGRIFATRGNGLTYGWSVDNQPYAVDRDNPRSPSQAYDTFISLGSREWNIAVPDGRYRVYLAVGDPSATNAVYGVEVEGGFAARGAPTVARPWVEEQVSVNVTDGNLTLRAMDGSRNNKLAFIHVAQVA